MRWARSRTLNSVAPNREAGSASRRVRAISSSSSSLTSAMAAASSRAWASRSAVRDSFMTHPRTGEVDFSPERPLADLCTKIPPTFETPTPPVPRRSFLLDKRRGGVLPSKHGRPPPSAWRRSPRWGLVPRPAHARERLALTATPTSLIRGPAMPRLSPYFGSLFIVIALGALVGCSDARGRQEGPGEVTLKGNPLDDGIINFAPLDGQGTGDGAQIVGGRYKIPKEKGLSPGKYRVTIYGGDGRSGTGDASPDSPHAGTKPGKD